MNKVNVNKVVDYANLLKENEILHSIIKEVREYIVSQKLHKIVDTTGGLTYEERKLLEILDKVEKENDIEFDVLKALNTDLDDDVEMG